MVIAEVTLMHGSVLVQPPGDRFDPGLRIPPQDWMGRMPSAEILVAPTVADVSEPLEQLRELARLRASGPLVATLYVRLDPDSRARKRYRIAVKGAVRNARASIPRLQLSHQDREALERDLARMEVRVEQADALPHARGLVLFACESARLFQLIPLPRVLTTRLVLEDRPRVAEAMAALEGSGRIVVALIDRAHGRFFEVTGSTVQELSGLAMPASRGGKYHPDAKDSPGWGERDFHNRIKEERRRQAAAVATILQGIVSREVCDGIVLAGPARSIADQRRYLTPSIAGRLLGTLPLNPTSVTPGDLASGVNRLRSQAERTRETALLTELQESVGTGWAVNGIRPTLRALARGQVRTLLLPSGQSSAGFRRSGSGHLVASRADGEGEGELVPVQDLVSELIDDGLEAGAEIHFIDDPDLARQIEGMAAILRFR